MSLAGKVALVTGGSRGIGFAIAHALVTRGASVAISGTNASRLDEAARALGAAAEGTEVLGVAADVRDPAAVDRLVARVVERFGGLDALVNNAGVGRFGPVAELSIDDWQTVIGTNLSGVFYCCRAALPHMRRKGAGWIVNISSLAGKNPFPDGAAYCASKAALNAFSEALMQEVRHDGVRVAYVLPGSVSTEFGGSARQRADWKLQPEDVAEAVVDLMAHPSRSLPSRVELRPARPPKK
ncbi:MAG: SDR family oxidoreductase [Acidimicrobiia bacterium]|nr:SDR family oxidoreductase [Acidimicrobiia bacterium]